MAESCGVTQRQQQEQEQEDNMATKAAHKVVLTDLLRNSGFDDEADLLEGLGHKKGDTVIIRTMTHTYIGTIQAIMPDHVALHPCAWVSESQPRWSEFLTGNTEGADIDRYPDANGPVVVMLAPASEISKWPGDVPNTQG